MNLTIQLINEKGWSCGQVAAELGATRNSVISKVQQLKRKGIDLLLMDKGGGHRISHPKKRTLKSKRVRKVPKVPKSPVITTFQRRVAEMNQATRKVVMPSGHTREIRVNSLLGRVLFSTKPLQCSPAVVPALMALEPRDCRWPMADTTDPSFRFCCAAAEEGAPYCPEHMSDMRRFEHDY